MKCLQILCLTGKYDKARLLRQALMKCTCDLQYY